MADTTPRRRSGVTWTRTHRGLRALALASLVVTLGTITPTAISAQKPEPGDERTVTVRDTAHVERRQTLFTYRDAILATGFTGLTFAMFPLDKRLARDLRQDSTFNRLAQNSAVGFETITAPGAYFIGGGLYLYGRLAKKPNVADFGWHGLESVIVGTTVTSFLKGTLGRSRPFVTADSNPRDFKFGGGFRSAERQSFPSGHTTTAFAVAASVTSETRRLHPKALPFVATIMYGGATLVGLSRMYHDKHWASDVALGAAIGTFSGLKVVRYSHAHPDNVVDRVILRTVIAPDGQGGGYLGFSLPAP